MKGNLKGFWAVKVSGNWRVVFRFEEGSVYEVDYLDYQPHVEDMKAVAVANVVRAWRSFDLERFNNPFAYFTQAIKHTFWQYVSQEKKHRLNRDAMLISIGEMPSDAYMEDYEKEMAQERREREGEQIIDSVNDYYDNKESD